MHPKLALLVGGDPATIAPILAKVSIGLIVGDQRSDAVALFAALAGIPYVLMSKDGRPDEEYDRNLATLLHRHRVTLVGVAGFGHELGAEMERSAEGPLVIHNPDPEALHRRMVAQRFEDVVPRPLHPAPQ